MYFHDQSNNLQGRKMSCEQTLSSLSVRNASDNKVHGANMGPIWGRQDPGGPQVGPMNFAIWVRYLEVSHDLNGYFEW